MLNRKEILETIDMVEKEHFDVRTITMGINLLSCIRDSAEETARLCYDKICTKAENIVKDVDIPTTPGHFNSVADGPFHPRSGGIIVFGHRRIKFLGDGFEHIPILQG